MTTLAEAFDNVPPVGKIYLPDCSYREMTEWALPAEQLVEYQRIAHEMQDDPRWAALRPLVRGGFWRNFRVKYPEADEMYCRMMSVSRRLQETLEAAAAGDPVNAELVEQARTELYRGQCNCGYWHGAFGGIYLPHLRNAVYQHLIAADNLLDRAVGRPDTWIEATADDFNFDARQEVRLTNDKLMALVAPSRGGQMIELDVRRIQHNLLATLARRPEAYHQKVLAGQRIRAAIRWRASTSASCSNSPTSTSGCNTTTTRARACWTCSTTTTRRWSRGRRHGPAARRFRRRRLRSPHPPQSRPHPGAIAPRRKRRRRADADHQGPDARRRQFDAASRLSAGEPAARPAAAFRRRVQFRRHAGQRLRPELPRHPRQACSASWARSSICATSSAWA